MRNFERMNGGQGGLRVGVIGLGGAAMQMLPSLMTHPKVVIAACADPNNQARVNFARDFDAIPYESAEELCENTGIDAVYIATPHQFHCEHTAAAARNGKHIIVEKPMALTLEDCDAMIAAAEDNRVRMLVGHTHSFDPPIQKMREIVRSGTLGRLAMINTFNYGRFLYRPRHPEELKTDLGGGIIFNQVPHQIDMVRLLGGGMLRSVRAMAWALDPTRPTEGSHSSFLQFEDGAVATVVYSGYDHFDSDEFNDWVGELGNICPPDGHGGARRALRKINSPEEEAALKGSKAYAEKPQIHSAEGHPHFGIVIACCEKGDIRTSATGLTMYSEEGRADIEIPVGPVYPDKLAVIDELCDAVEYDCEPLHNGRWGKATMEATLAILESTRKRQEIFLAHQVAAECS